VTRRLLCLVTDRRRLAERAARPQSDASSLLLAQLEGAIRGGIDLVQIRELDIETRELARLVAGALGLAAGTPTRVLVNDRVDVAVAVGADGVHLREASPSAHRIRDTWPALMIGRSVHSRDAMGGDARVDYWIAGTVFPSASKPDANVLGVEGFARLVDAAAGVPVVAIGGITETTLPRLVQAGAHGIAAIGAFLPAAGAVDIGAAVEKRVTAMRFAFDSASSRP
jgi:thiamine-phosphate pyrophosphorylase